MDKKTYEKKMREYVKELEKLNDAILDLYMEYNEDEEAEDGNGIGYAQRIGLRFEDLEDEIESNIE